MNELLAIIGDPRKASLSAPWDTHTVSNSEEHSEQAERKVSDGAKYTRDGFKGVFRSESHLYGTYW